MNRWITFTILGMVFLATACGNQKNKTEPSSTTSVKVTKVEKRSFAHQLELTSTVQADNQAMLTPKVAGVVEKIFKDKGDRVNAGDQLARLDQTDYLIGLDAAKAQRTVAEAAVAQAKVVFETVEINYQRFQELFSQKAVSSAEFEKVETGYAQAKAGLAVAQAQLVQAGAGLRAAKRRLNETVIKAPFAGYIVQRMMDIGEMATPQRPLFMLVNSDKVEFDVSVTELEIASLKVGMEAKIRVDAFSNETFVANIELINERIDPATRTVSVRLIKDNADHRIKPGMTARVRIVLPEKEYVVVPRAALLTRDNEEGTVFVVRDDMTIEERKVLISGGESGYSILTEGVSVGETIVVGGGTHLVDGQKITIVQGE